MLPVLLLTAIPVRLKIRYGYESRISESDNRQNRESIFRSYTANGTDGLICGRRRLKSVRLLPKASQASEDRVLFSWNRYFICS